MNTNEVGKFFDALGGGPGAVIILTLAATVMTLWIKLLKSYEARIEDQKLHTLQMLEITRVLDGAVRTLERRNA